MVNAAPVTVPSRRRLEIARTVYQIAVEELTAAEAAFRASRTQAADRRLRAAWAAHRSAAERLNALSRGAR